MLRQARWRRKMFPMPPPRFKDCNWSLPTSDDGKTIATWEAARLAVLMDIRDELQDLNRLLRCPNFLSIPAKLKQISRNTAKPRKAKP